MSSASLDLQKLAKVLQLTDSTHDGEALNSVRLANQLLKKAGVTYEELLREKEAEASVDKLRTEYLKRMRGYMQKHQEEMDALKEAHQKELDYLNRRIAWWRERTVQVNQKSHQEEILKLNRKIDWWHHKYQYLLERTEQEKAELAANMTKRISYWRSKVRGTLIGDGASDAA
ncbi:MAG: hypothetical protein HQL82_03235 [Magnetococcales bacterium]|nr:hypothetical protein [Magnetococcales bacterium]